MKTIIKIIKKLLRRSRKKAATPVLKHIVRRDQHQISKADISENALKVLNRLHNANFEAYLVGGSVRDLLLRKAPKDFDVATNATPTQIRRLFRNARIIGRRFKLVHILFHREIIEVATFRGHEESDSKLVNEKGMLIRDNVFGTLEEDAWRRDFSINSLYYNIEDFSIVDLTGGVLDVEKKQIRLIGEPLTRFQEDPVRMLRAIRFSAKLHFTIEERTASALHQQHGLISHISGSRLFDEMTKLYQSGEAMMVQKLLMEYGLFQYLFTQTHQLLQSEYPMQALIGIALENTDTRIISGKPVTPAFLFAVFLWFPMLHTSLHFQEEGLSPLPAIEKAMSVVLGNQCQVITIPKRFTQMIREIWIMQFRFAKRTGNRAYQLLSHPRFRAAYDFLALRALAGDESMELADWWTTFQEADEFVRQQMISLLSKSAAKKRGKKTSGE